MLCSEIIKGIEERYPVEYACDWDNVGLLVGRSDKEVEKIYLALDATDPVIRHAAAWGADMLVTHHPMIFGSLRRINDGDFLGRKILRMIREDISYYAMHTNFDVAGMAELSADLLGLTDRRILDETVPGRSDVGIGRVGDLPREMTLAEAAQYVKDALKLPHVTISGDADRPVRRAAICPGSGKSEVANALALGATVLIAGDIDHHTALDAAEQGLSIIDAGHYGTEYIFMEEMERYLRGRFPELLVAKEPMHVPFSVVS